MNSIEVSKLVHERLFLVTKMELTALLSALKEWWRVCVDFTNCCFCMEIERILHLVVQDYQISAGTNAIRVQILAPCSFVSIAKTESNHLDVV